MIDLRAVNLHFKNHSRSDLCLHGDVLFKIGDVVISNLEDNEWCVSVYALRFLRTLDCNHLCGEEEHMIPCCGHFMIPSEDKKKVTVIGCKNGVDFDVIHEKDGIIIKCMDGRHVCCLYDEYKAAVILFAKQIDKYMKESPARIPEDTFSAEGFDAFKNEFNLLLDNAIKTNNKVI